MMEHTGMTPQESVSDSQLQRLAEAACAAHEPSKRIDVNHNPDLDLLGGVMSSARDFDVA